MIQTKIILCILILVVLSIYIFYKYFEGFQNSPPTDATILKDRILDIIKYSDWGDTTRDIYEIGPDVGDISNWYVYILDNTFRKAPNLHTIRIKDQSIYALNTYTFTGLRTLKELDLRNNPIKVIGSNIFYNNFGLRKTNEDGNVETNQFFISEQDTKILIVIYPETLLRLALLNKPSYNPHLSGLCYENINEAEYETKIYEFIQVFARNLDDNKYKTLILEVLGVSQDNLSNFQIKGNDDNEYTDFSSVFRLVYYKDMFFDVDLAYWRCHFYEKIGVTREVGGTLPNILPDDELDDDGEDKLITKYCVYSENDNRYISSIEALQRRIEEDSFKQDSKSLADNFKGALNSLLGRKDTYGSNYYSNKLQDFIGASLEIPEFILFEITNVNRRVCRTVASCIEAQQDWHGSTGFKTDIPDTIRTVNSSDDFEFNKTNMVLSQDNINALNPTFRNSLSSCQVNMLEPFYGGAPADYAHCEFEDTAQTLCVGDEQDERTSVKSAEEVFITNITEIPEATDDENTHLFRGSTTLQRVVFDTAQDLDNQLETIGSRAFMECVNLNSLTIHQDQNNMSIPNSVTEIGEYAFFKCGNTNSDFDIIIDKANSSLTSLGANAFKESSITTMSIPDSLENIEASTFDSCSRLTNVDIDTVNSRLEKIKALAFLNCSSLESFILPNSLEEIEDKAFEGCSNLVNATFGPNFSKLGEASYKNSGLIDINIPQSVTEIPKDCFMGCDKITEITLPSAAADGNGGLTIIGENAFRGCTELLTLLIPKTIERIESNAFEGCTKLHTIEFEEGMRLPFISNTAFVNNISLTTVKGLKKNIVSSAAFANCGCDDCSFNLGIDTVNCKKDYTNCSPYLLKGKLDGPDKHKIICSAFNLSLDKDYISLLQNEEERFSSLINKIINVGKAQKSEYIMNEIAVANLLFNIQTQPQRPVD